MSLTGFWPDKSDMSFKNTLAMAAALNWS